MPRVRLKHDFTDRDGYPHFEGETGNVIHVGSETVLVEFDGYEEAKQQNAELLAKHGEGFNVVPYLSEIPKRLIEVINEADR